MKAAAPSLLEATPSTPSEAIDPAADLIDGVELELPEPPSEAIEAPLPAARPDGSPTRIRLDDDLMVEVDVQDTSVEVTLEGADDQVEPLADLGRELEDALETEGFDLDSFGHRRHSSERRAELYRPRRIARREALNTDDSAPDPKPRSRPLGVGRHVDVVV